MRAVFHLLCHLVFFLVAFFFRPMNDWFILLSGLATMMDSLEHQVGEVSIQPAWPLAFLC